MSQLAAGDTAPDFALPDHHGRLSVLSELLRAHNVLLVFNLGFA